MRFINSKLLGTLIAFSYGITAVVSLLAINSCGGKVANLSAASGSSYANLSFLSTDIYGIQVGVVNTGISTSGGFSPLVFSISGGALPVGLKLDEATGQISGNIASALAEKEYLVTILVTDSAALTATKTFTGKIASAGSTLSIQTKTIANFIAGVSYMYPILTIGGTGALSYSVYSGKLPSGITIDSASGVISGTPAVAAAGGSYAFGIRVVDTVGQVSNSEIYIGITASNPVGSVHILSTAIYGLNVGTVTTGLATSGGATPLNFLVTAGTIPAGLTLDALTGAITGSIGVGIGGTTYAFSVTVTDAGSTTDTKLYTGIINAGSSSLTLHTDSISTFAAGLAYSFPFTVSGGYSPYIFAISSGTLPSGLTLNTSTGIISGTPLITTGGQSYNFTVTVSDTSGQVQSRQFFGTVAPNSAAAVAIISTTLPGIAVGAITTGLSTSGGVVPLTFAIANGTLPTGLTLNTANGVISGTIEVASANTGYAVAISVVDSTGSTDIKTFTGIVGAGNSVMAIASTTIANFAAGISYTNPIIVTGGAGPFAYTISSGSLPSGIVINSTTGIISGTPVITSGGIPYSFTVNVQDSASQTQARAFSGSVAANSAAAIRILSTSLPGVGVGSVTTGITTSGGVPPLSFVISSGALPAGLSISATTGIISGTIEVISANTAYAAAISVTDSSNSTALQSYTGIVAAGTAVLTLNSTTVAAFTAGIAYSCPLVTTGGSPAYSFVISSGALPSGIVISSSTGALTGTPILTSGGTAYTFTVTVTDASSQTQSRSFVGTIASNSGAAIAIISTTINGLTVGAVTSGISTTGGISPLVFAVAGGSLPAGLSLNTSTGAITGTIPVSSAGLSYAASISVTDAANTTASQTFSGTVSAGTSALVLNTTVMSPFIAGINYSYPLVATNGVPAYSFSVSAGTLPAGVSLNVSSGVVSGTPTVATANQSYGFTITVTDSASQTKSQTFVGTVATSSAANLQITTASITAPTAGSPYVAGISISGGTSPYVFTVSSGALPAGITINASSGIISGTPVLATKGSSFLFAGTVTDASNLTASVTYSGTVGTYATTLYPPSFSGASPGALYSVALSTLGGQSTFTYAITAGTLPSGLSLNSSTGLISGTVAEGEAGLAKSVTIRSTDTNGVIATASYSITTSAFAITVSTTSLTSPVEMAAYTNGSTNLGATGGTGPYTFEYTGTLPTGVGLTSAGAFFGTPALASGSLSAGTTYTISVRARDAIGILSGQKTLTMAVTISIPTVDAVTPSNATLGASYSHTVTASGGRAPFTFAVTAGALPTGLTVGASGVISGIASIAATCPANQFTIRATDALSQISAASVKCIATLNGVNITNALFPVVVVGVNYSASLTVTGGTPPYTHSGTGLPSGVTVNSSTGALVGFTNAASGDYSTYLTVIDSSTPALSTTRTFTFTVRDGFSLAAATLPRGAALSAYGSGSGYQLTATGGQTPYTYVITSGGLPSGLAMSTAGLISGTPISSTAATNGGAYSISVVATDALGSSTNAAAFGLTIQTTPKILDSKLPAALLNSPYAYDLVRVGGSNEFNGSSQATRLTYALASGSSLPIGLTLGAATGRIYGTPTSNGASPYTFTIEVTDAYGMKGTKALTLAINSVAKTLDLKTAHFSDPCLGTSQCTPTANTIELLTATTAPAAVSANTQQFLVSVRGETATRSIQIAKIDSTGRVPKASSTVLSINVPLPANITGTLAYIKVADIDQDGFKDIIFSDTGINQVCVLWNGGTVDSVGMPNTFSATNIDCFPMPRGAAVTWPTFISVINNLRPDATNNGKMDVIVTNTNTVGSSVTVLKNNCAVAGACTNPSTQRPVIFDGYVAFTGTTTASSAFISAVASTAGVQIGQPIVGIGIPAGATVASFVANTSINLSTPATLTRVGTKLALPKAVILGNGTTVNGSRSITSITSTAGIVAGQQITHANFAAGTRVISFTATTIVASANATASSAQPLTVYGPVTHTPIILASGNRMRDTSSAAIGWFIAAKPEIPAGVIGVDNCPGIVVAGFDISNTANGYEYVMRQSFSGGECQGDFITHIASDEYLAATGSPWLTSVVAEDFNNDGLTDIVVGAATVGSTPVRVYLTAGGATFTNGTIISPQLQMRNGAVNVVGAGRVTSFCLDGTTSCVYPSLIVQPNTGTATVAGSISILPNQCSTPGCLTPFESTTPLLRIDYPAPLVMWGIGNGSVTTQQGELQFKPLISNSNATPTGTTTAGSAVITDVSSTTGVTIGQPISGANILANAYVTAFSAGSSTITLNSNANASGSITLTIPTIPTLLDIGTAGTDQATAAPYFLTYRRNGSSTTDPFKGTMMLDVFPASYSQLADVGTTRLTDINGDGKLDLFAFAVSNGFVGAYVSSSSGGVSYDLNPGQLPNYISHPNQNGCLGASTACFPDPVLNLMGVQQGFPNPSTNYNDNVMDVGDVNNDGIPDVAVTGYYSRGVAVAVGTVTGDLNAPILYEMGTAVDVRPQSFALTDMDQDGFLDVILVGVQFINAVPSGAASWLKGNGDGTFQNAAPINNIVGNCIDPRVVVPIDLDQDGRPELSVLCYSTQLVYVSRRNSSGDWVFQTSSTINAVGGSNGVGMRWGRTVTSTAGGFDLATVGLDATNTLRISNGITLTVTNAGTGAFTINGNQGTYVTLNGFGSMVDIADLNGDGFGDVVVPMRSTVNSTVQNNGTYVTCQSTTTGVGTCQAKGWGMEGLSTSSVSIGDLGSDGLPELIIGYGGISGYSRLLYRNISRVLNTSY